MGEIRGDQFDGAVRADMRRGDRDLGPVADAKLAHDFADMNFHGRFGHTELATDHLVGVALAETNEDGVLPLGIFGRVPRAVKAMVARHASRLVVEKGALLLVGAVLRTERRCLRLLFGQGLHRASGHSACGDRGGRPGARRQALRRGPPDVAWDAVR